MRLLLVDDDVVDRRAVRRALLLTDPPVDVEEAPTLLAARKLLETRSFDCALLDVALPDGSGLELLPSLRASSPGAAVVVLTGRDDVAVATHALRDGAQDYVQKSSLQGESLIRCLRHAVERKRTEDLRVKMVHAERLVSLGTLSAGVAHEINNPLQAVMANLTFALEDLGRVAAQLERLSLDAREALERAREVLEECDRGCHRMRMMVLDLQMFTRARESDIGLTTLGAALEAALNMAGAFVRDRARLSVSLDESPLVRANPTHLAQVVLNLLMNAAQAIPEGNAEHNHVKIVVGVREGRALLEITDSGEGIPASLHQRIFEPFFTTRPVGAGTGLGLAICHEIIRALGGRIDVESEPGCGATFRVLLPPADEARTSRQEVRADRAESGPFSVVGRARIMLIEDDIMVLSALERALGDDYDVVGFFDARRALGRIRAGDRFDLILTDLAMPELSGDRMLAQLEELGFDCERVAFITAGPISRAAERLAARRERIVIRKPIDVATLRARVRRLLVPDPS